MVSQRNQQNQQQMTTKKNIRIENFLVGKARLLITNKDYFTFSCTIFEQFIFI